MKPLTIPELAEIRFNTSSKLCPIGVGQWDNQSDTVRNANIAGMTAALSAYHASLGEGMPGLEVCRDTYLGALEKDQTPRTALDAVRNLMLSALAKRTTDLQKESDGYFTKLQAMTENRNHWAASSDKAKLERDAALAKLAAVSKLPEKWRFVAGSLPSSLTSRAGEYAQLKTVAVELEMALSTPHTIAPEIQPQEEWTYLCANDIPPGSFLRWRSWTGDHGCWVSILQVTERDGVLIGSTVPEWVSWEKLWQDFVILRPGSTWQPCRKLKTSQP